MHYLGIAIVRFKKSVLEPQGKAIQLSLEESGHKGIDLVRVGKHIEVTLEAESRDDAQKKMETLAEELLYNPVMETCEIHIEDAS